MSYLLEHTRVRPASTAAARLGTRVDECTLLNHPVFDGGAHVRVFVEDTTNRRVRRRRIPSPRLKLRIADCTNTVHLEFSVDTLEARSNSLFKIETLLAALRQFHAGLAAEAELREKREYARQRQ
jgi:hypothetical protein